PDRVLLCDRGTVDGAAYWPDGPDEFFAAVGSSLEHELARYDAVVFFETAAAGGIAIEGGNPARTESVDEAYELDQRLRAVWEQHRRFYVIRHRGSFLQKVTYGLAVLQEIVDQHEAK
ncbi:MAG: AAA family ATPase, partial [Polyangiales bacterium]